MALTLRGDLHKQRAAEAKQAERSKEEEAALGAYSEAVKADPKYAPPHRELGLIHMKRGEPAPARTHLEKYLELAPQAEDRQIVRDYLAELK